MLLIRHIASEQSGRLSLPQKERFLANSRQAFGRSALLLSGGVALGVCWGGLEMIA